MAETQVINHLGFAMLNLSQSRDFFIDALGSIEHFITIAARLELTMLIICFLVIKVGS